MMSIKELSSNNTEYSTVRYAFITVVRFDMVVISAVLLAYIISHLMNKPLDDSLLDKTTMLIGVLTTLTTGSKMYQDFSNRDYRSNYDNKVEQ